MKNSLRMFCIVAVFIMTGASVVTAAQKNTAAPAADSNKPDYYSLVKKLKNNDTNIDFAALRLSYAKTKDYMPYGGDESAKDAAFDALDKKNYAEALKQAEIFLAKNYVDMEMHLVSFIAYRESGNAEKAAFHRSVFKGLINSLSASGDGTAPESAMVVISVPEEYAYFRANGFKPDKQSKITVKGHDYDKMEVVNKDTGENKIFYFNIDLPIQWLEKSLQKK
jgi:hypothetical protein